MSNLSLQHVDLVKEVLRGNELVHVYTGVFIAQFLHYLFYPLLVLLGRPASQRGQVRLQEVLGRDAAFLVGLERSELIAPEVLPEPRLHIKEVLDGDVFFACEENLDQCKVRFLEVILTCGNSAHIHAHFVRLASASLRTLAEFKKQLAALLLGHLAVRVFLHGAAKTLWGDLQQHEEEEELSERDYAISIGIDLLQDLGHVILQILFRIIEDRGVAEGSHCAQKILVAHTQLALLRLLASKDFESFLRW